MRIILGDAGGSGATLPWEVTIDPVGAAADAVERARGTADTEVPLWAKVGITVGALTAVAILVTLIVKKK